jgi:hypothetical protein
MKTQSGVIFNAIIIAVVLIIASSCEKEDEITREKIIGDWLLKREIVNDAWVNGYLLDKRSMVLRREHEYRGVNTIRDSYYSKLD